MNWEQKNEYRKNASICRGKLIDQLCLHPEMSRTEKDIITLRIMELDIMPDSRAWRWGYKGVLKRSRKALEKQLEVEKNEDRNA